MTTEPEATPETRSGPRRPATWRVGTPVVLGLCGALIAVSYSNSEGTDLRPGRYDDMAGLARAEADRYDQVRDDVSALEDEIARLTENVESEEIQRLRDRIDKFSGPAGLQPVTGPGVRVELSDAPAENFDRAADQGNIHLQDFVVHQQDIQSVVNAMWLGGARAVTVNGQRISGNTGIKCEGNAVTLDGIPYPQPYVIQGIGDQDSIQQAINEDGTLRTYRLQAADPAIEIGWSMETSEDLEAAAYEGSLTLDHAKPLGR